MPEDLELLIYLSGGGTVSFDQEGLSNFARDHLGQLQKGDYMWISSFDPPYEAANCSDTAIECGDVHGLLIVGWYTPMTYQAAIDDNTFILSRFFNSPPSDTGVFVIPYVADFTSVQQPVPRPFYCTQYKQDGWAGFVNHDWFFYTLPDLVDIPFGQIYVDPEWQWEASDGD